MLKNRFDKNIMVSLKRAILEGEVIDDVYVNDEMGFAGELPIECFSCSPSFPSVFSINGWDYPYSILNFSNIDYCIYNRLHKPDEFEDVFTDKIPAVLSNGTFRMVGEKSWFLKTPYIEWVYDNEISINIGGETMVILR